MSSLHPSPFKLDSVQPAPLRGNELDTFTYSSIVHRLPEIGQRTLSENTFPPEVVQQIKQLLGEIPGGPIRYLQDDAPDAAAWSAYIEPHLGANWLDPPWFFVENFFYRRVLEATGYFTDSACNGVDPFRHQKRQGLAESEAAVHNLSKQALNCISRDLPISQTLNWLWNASLWGNKADLSMWPSGQGADVDNSRSSGPDRTLVDDSDRVSRFLSDQQDASSRIDILIDNAGFELAADLTLAACLLSRDIAPKVTLHIKSHPTYVSDATEDDVQRTAAYLAGSGHPETSEMGGIIASQLNSSRLVMRSHPFWTSPLPAWRMPGDLRDSLKDSALIISKGDAHYRRLLGDLHWPYTTPIDQILGYIPSPLLALRTLKSEVAAGISPEQLERAEGSDPEWLFSGQWGIIQFYLPPAASNQSPATNNPRSPT